MAKPKVAGSSEKSTFGKRKAGQEGGKKSYNKHSPKPKAYRGQGRQLNIYQHDNSRFIQTIKGR